VNWGEEVGRERVKVNRPNETNETIEYVSKNAYTNFYGFKMPANLGLLNKKQSIGISRSL
jgi:hypothetical protein